MSEAPARREPEEEHSDRDRRYISTRRLEAFTDGVFAIAATLLVIDLSADELGGTANIHDSAALWAALGSVSDKLLSFAISFLLLCMLWAIHARQFEYIARVDQRMTVLNSLRLLGVVLIPFTTSMNSEYSDTTLGRMVMPINFVFVSIIGVFQWAHATNPRHNLMDDDASESLIRDYKLNGYVAVGLGLVVVALSPLIGSWAFFAYAFNVFFMRLFNNTRKKRSAEKRSAADPRIPGGG